MEKVFFMQLKGRQRFLRLLGDSKKSKGLRSGLVTLKSKEEVGEHDTGPSEEVILVISGTGAIKYKDKSDSHFCIIKVKKNSFVYIPPKTPHNVINVGKSLLRYLYTAARK